MSTELLRKSLELVDPECFATGKTPSSKKCPGSKKSGGKGMVGKRSAKQANRSKRDLIAKSSASMKRPQRCVTDDKTSENLRRLKLLGESSTIDVATANKLLSRATEEHKEIKIEKPKKKEKTAFTDEDFAKFEKEYFVSG